MDFIIESLYGVTKKLDSWGGYSKSPESRRKVRASAFKPSPNRARSPGRTEKLVSLEIIIPSMIKYSLRKKYALR